MDTFLAVRAWLESEGRVIWDAPYSLWSGGCGGGVGRLQVFSVVAQPANNRTQDDHSGLTTTHAAAMELQQQRNEILKDENDALKRELEQGKSLSGPASMIPVNYGNATVQNAVAEIRAGAVTFYGTPDQWSEPNIKKFAAMTHLQDAGLAKIDITEQPTTATATGSPVLLGPDSYLSWPRDKKGS